MKSFKTKRLEECIRFYGKDWTLYTDDAFQRKLEQPGYRLNCTFQDGFCLWKNDDERKSQIKWEIISGKTPSVNTGPDYDHTTKNGKGKYLYMEASSTTRHSKKEGDVARLTSVKLNVPRLCFAMHYHMYGKQIGSLNVKLIHEDRTESTIWNAKGNLGRAWRFMETSIAKDKPYQIVIEAVRGTHWAGDISVDDITINAGRCANSDEETNPCGISCRSRDARRFKLNTNVTDGMRCSSNPRDSNICLKGQCVRFGCDNKFNSRLKLDNCGVCGGKGDGCKQRRGRKEIAPEKDYETLLTLEKGSTFIKLKSTTEGRYYLGLRKSTGTGMYLNTNVEDYHVISGLTFLFRNMGSGTQEILSNGPLPENMDVLVYSYDRKRVAITYEYFAPLNAEPVYQYLVVGWQPCSQTCGFGKQNAKVDCRRVEDKKAVDERFCNNLKKPVYTKVCQNEACPRRTIWNAHEWSRCTQTCGEGQQLRVVTCIDEENKQPVSNNLCDSFKMPQLTRQCNTRACPPEYKWTIEGWGQCTTTCGEGIRTREVLCNDITTNRTASDAKCATEKPSSREPCNIQECETYIYEVSLEGACSKTCGGGIKARIVYCISKASRAIVLNKYCDGPSPPRIAQCNTDACPEFVEKVIEETPCSVTCGSGTKIQRRVCLNKETGKEVDGKNCKDFQLKALVVCTMEKCPIKRLEYTPWSTCSKLCGEGKQIRAAKCMDDKGNEYTLNECETVQPNLLLRSCKENECSQPAQVKCDFDSRSFCNWENLKTDQFEWNIGKKTPSFSTGPLKDHTTGKGYFAYIETSRPRQRDEIAFLASPVLTVSHGCLRFWYHMRGSSTGTLKVTINKNIMFEETGQQGMEWKLAEIDIMPPDTTKTGYRFIFHGIVGHNVYGDIAIDDIIFVEESCSKTTANTKGSSKCREISPYCKHERRVLLCKQSAPYRGLCCETCKAYI